MFTPSATVVATIVGGGGKGSIGNVRSEQKPIGKTVSLKANGAEASECNQGFERKTSGASVDARVTAPAAGVLDFFYSLVAKGGHYVTAAACAAGTVIGKTGHDTTATAIAEVQAKSTIIMRADSPPPMRVDYARMPANSSVRIVDWQGRPLKIPRTETVRGDTTTVYDDIPATLSGSGSFTVATHGPGFYLLEATLRLNASVTGNVDAAQADTATVRLSPVP